MGAGIDGRILRGEIIEQRDPVMLSLRWTGARNRAAETLLRQALIGVARIFPREAMPVIVAALLGELLCASRVVVIRQG